MKKFRNSLVIAMVLWTGALSAEEMGLLNHDADKWVPKELTNVMEDNIKCIKTVDAPYLIFKEVFPVEVNKNYVLSGEFKSIGKPGAICHLGISCLDENNNPLPPRYVNQWPGTDTELVEPCTYDDKILKIKDGEKWKAGDYFCVAFNTDPLASDLPNRNISRGWGIVKVEKKDSIWEITLKDSCGKDFPEGTKVREHRDSHPYNYVAGSLTGTDQWQSFTGKITGISRYCEHNAFRPGTKFVQVRFILNYNKIEDCVMLFKNIKFEEIK
jgi:hypothetical protein